MGTAPVEEEVVVAVVASDQISFLLGKISRDSLGVAVVVEGRILEG